MYHGSGGREHVSFGTNMSLEEYVSDDGAMDQKADSQSTTIDRFHARRFKVKAGQSTEKRAILKVTGTGRSNKKQKNTNQRTHEGGSKELDGTWRPEWLGEHGRS
jgi:hypothetical protein